ncbi:MAG: dihydrolipoamide acetyltransferase family protein [Solirubrobacterales bacterium]
MTDQIVMPRLSDSMEEGLILGWLKSDGDRVEVGDELVEIETDKASMVYESDLAGVLEILVPAGETRPVGEPIATVSEGEAGGSPEGAPPESAETVAEEPTPVEEPAAAEPTPVPPVEPPPEATTAEEAERIRISPLASRLAREKGLDPAGIEGSGPNGRIVKADVDRALAAGNPPVSAEPVPAPREGEPAKGAVTRIELDRTQQTIARRMAESKATVPHFYLRTVVDMTRAVEVREAFKASPESDEPAPSLNDMVVKAAALALRHHPRANSSYRDGALDLFSRINIGIAVASNDALIVPVISDADHLELRQIATEARRLAERVRTGEVTPPELSGGTFTITNLGMYGVRSFDAVIHGGQAAILAVGEISERALVRDGDVVPAMLMDISLACDHRVLYGADAAEFLAEIRANLEEPGLLA